jgi:hypothetical protein
MDKSEITKINGPVNFYEFKGKPNSPTKIIFYFIGDVHYSTGYGCDKTHCQTMNKDKDNISPIIGNGSCMDLDAAMHTWLLYNNSNGIKTDLFIENPIFKSRNISVLRREKELEEEFSTGWIGIAAYMYSPCFYNKNKCPYGPNSRIHLADVRQSDENVIDIFTWISILETTPETNIIFEYIIGNMDKIWKAYTRIDSFHLLREVRDGILKLDIKNISNSVAKSMDKYAKYISTLRVITKPGGKTEKYRMHKTAWQIYKLFTSGKENDATLAKKIVKFINEEYESLKNVIIAFSDKSFFTDIGALIMDGYTLSRAFYYKPDVCIIHTGVAHSFNYIKFIREYLEYVETFGADNTLQYINEDGKYDDGISNADRCIKSDKLPYSLDFAKMRNFLEKKGIYDRAESKIKDILIS